MFNQYYYFIAGLPNISIDDSKLVFAPDDIRHQAKEHLSKGDFALLEYLHLPDYLNNLLSLIYYPEKEFSVEGLWDKEILKEYLLSLRTMVLTPDERYTPIPKFIPKYVTKALLDAYAMEEFPVFAYLEKRFLVDFYNEACSHKNRFIRDFFTLKRDMKNILCALNGRKHQLPFAQYLIGEGEVIDNLKSSHAADFGLGKESYILENILRIYEQNDALWRERGYDIFVAKWIDEHNFFESFSIDRILGYYCTLRIIHRWIKADAELGKELFKQTLASLQGSFSFPEDFQIKIKQK